MKFPNAERCRVPSFDVAEVKASLSGKHILFMGDSISRYLYTSLAHYLATGDWPERVVDNGDEAAERESDLIHGTGGIPGRTVNVVWQKNHASWYDFLKHTNDVLNTASTSEHCDCYRESGEQLHATLTENRYFRDLKNNINISYVGMFTPTLPSRGNAYMNPHDPEFNRSGPRFSFQRGDWTWETEPGGEFLEEQLSRRWSSTPDVIVVNTGAW